jgi:hypothetical protein
VVDWSLKMSKTHPVAFCTTQEKCFCSMHERLPCISMSSMCCFKIHATLVCAKFHQFSLCFGLVKQNENMKYTDIIRNRCTGQSPLSHQARHEYTFNHGR